MAKILFVITASDHWTLSDGTRQPAGVWAEDAIGPYQVFKSGPELKKLYDRQVATEGGH